MALILTTREPSCFTSSSLPLGKRGSGLHPGGSTSRIVALRAPHSWWFIASAHSAASSVGVMLSLHSQGRAGNPPGLLSRHAALGDRAQRQLLLEPDKLGIERAQLRRDISSAPKHVLHHDVGRRLQLHPPPQVNLCLVHGSPP